MLSPGKPPLSQAAETWFDRHDDDMWLSVITVAELHRGVAKLAHLKERPVKRVEALETWLAALEDEWRDRIIDLDASIARRAGYFYGRAEATDRFR